MKKVDRDLDSRKLRETQIRIQECVWELERTVLNLKIRVRCLEAEVEALKTKRDKLLDE